MQCIVASSLGHSRVALANQTTNHVDITVGERCFFLFIAVIFSTAGPLDLFARISTKLWLFELHVVMII